MESGQKSLAEIVSELQMYDRMACRLVLHHTEDGWQLRYMVIDVITDQATADWSVYDYGRLVFLSDTLDGARLSDWLSKSRGEVAGFSFHLPELRSHVDWMRHTSHFRSSGIFRKPEPNTCYLLRAAQDRFESNNANSPLVKDRCPSFPDNDTAIYKLLYDLDRQAGQDMLRDVIITIRVTHSDAWIDHVTLRPGGVSVTVCGSNVADSRLVIGGKGKGFDAKLISPGTFDYEIPDGLPNRLWMILSRGDRWLDSRDLDISRIPSLTWGNVTFGPGSVCEQIKEWIHQGENNHVEFKEQLPLNEDKFLKTVAAFANGTGGVILLGVVNGTGEVKGIKDEIGPYKDGITDRIRRKVIPDTVIHIEHCEIDGALVVAVIVEEGEGAPYGLTNGPDKTPSFYVRRNATTFTATQAEIRALARKKSDEVVTSRH